MQQSHLHPSSQNAQMTWGGPFPSLHLWPLHETFAMKMIHLPEGQRIKIGRQTNARTVPGERNAYFDSKVLSRLHAEVWEQGGKMYIKDVKSSNGTFINTERLSPEGIESDPYELKSEDMVEFGIDIVSEDNRTIVHHKVAAKIYCVFGTEDAALSARESSNYQPHQNRRILPAPSQPQNGPQLLSSGGKANGLSFNVVLLKLQDELAKSRDIGAGLQNLTGSMTEIQQTLGGGLPPAQNGASSQLIPPQYRSNSAEAQAALASPHGQQAAAFIALQGQLNETQNSLNTHIDRIRSLESGVNQNENLKSEMLNLKEQMEQTKREMDLILSGNRGRPLGRRTEDDSGYGDDYDDDDDDARSVATVTDHPESKSKPRNYEDYENRDAGPNGIDQIVKDKKESEQNTELLARVQTLSAEVAEAGRLSQNLHTQHSEAMSAVRLLTEKVTALELGIASRIAEAVSETDKKWESWRSTLEEGWKKERESWDAERERLRSVVRDWEEASRRAHEEEEERALNERLSAGDSTDDELDKTVKKTIAAPKKSRRRRPSHKTLLAVNALRELADEGASTPKPNLAELDGASTSSLKPFRALESEGRKFVSVLAEKESSESGRESGDTLRTGRISRQSERPSEPQSLVSIPVFTVVVVAVVAGAFYYTQKD